MPLTRNLGHVFAPVLTLFVAALLAAGPADAALISTSGDGETSELRFQKPGAELSAPVASFTHVKRSTVLGALLPGSRTVVAIAQTVEQGDLTFSASLFRLEPGKSTVVLADRVALATRPLVTRTGRLFVQRSHDGQTPSIDEIDPRTGAARTVHTFAGFTAFLAGAFEGELLVYRVGPAGADLVAVHADALGVRVLVPHLAPMARDFATDGRGLFFTTADAEGWLVAKVELKTGELRTVARAREVAALPTVLDGRLALSPGPGEGLRFTDGSLALLPRGPGFERVLHVRGGWAFVLHERPSEFPAAYASELTTGRLFGIAAPARMRLDLAGVAE